MKLCEICGKLNALYVCKGCGSSACEMCFDTSSWLCLKCLREARWTPKASPSIFFKLFLMGFVLAFLGTLLMIASALTSVTAGGFFMVGPIPILWGVGPYAHLATLLSVVMAIVLLILILIWVKGVR